MRGKEKKFMEFEWDEEKNTINKVKHNISFEIAAHVLMTLNISKCLILSIALMRTDILPLAK